LVWFLAFAGVLWSFNGNERYVTWAWTAFALCVGGTAVITLSPFLGAGNPLMNNYVPVLQDPIFLTGLGLFGIGFTVLALHGLLYSRAVGMTMSGEGALRFGLSTAQLIGLLAVLALLASWYGMPAAAQGRAFYELLFWGPRTALFLFALGTLPALATPYFYLAHEVGSAGHILGLTWLMKVGGGLAALPMALLILLSVFSTGSPPETTRPERNALLFSILLFGVGGVIGFLISGSNVTIPAHYHGSIVAITLAYMGITYHLLPRLGFRKPTGKWVARQPAIYGTGQLMHVLGLAWSGGYGVQRKTAGSEQGLKTIQEIAGMGIMGLGGMIAIIGGILFLVIVFKAMWPRTKEQ